MRVFYQIWHRPLLTVNGAHMISDVIALCGGENVFADVRQLTPSVTLEAVIAASARGDPGRGLGRRGEGICRAVARVRRAAAARPAGVLRQPGHDPAADAAHRGRGAKAVCAALEEVRSRRR